jgi:hypothetical protein
MNARIGECQNEFLPLPPAAISWSKKYLATGREQLFIAAPASAWMDLSALLPKDQQVPSYQESFRLRFYRHPRWFSVFPSLPVSFGGQAIS